ncbi:MAG TPA: DUF4012 domain-containing protein [Chloroflexi bacterium]|nr:DUF4012 domain-containing protein [Chloroflexota bacterium]
MTDKEMDGLVQVDQGRDGRARLEYGCLVLAAMGVVLLLAWGAPLGRAGLSLRKHLIEAQALAERPQSLDPAAACELVRDLRADVVTLEGRAGWLARMAPALGWLPGIGGDLRAVPHLLTVGDGLSEAGALACDGMGPALTALGGDGDLSLEGVVQLLVEEQATLEGALTAVERAQDAWSQVDVEALSPWLAGKAALLERGLPLLRAGLSAVTIAPDLLGMDEPCTYLVIALNEDELRPGGGFISGVGEVRVEAGQLISMTFRDSYGVDDFTQPYPTPPDYMRRFMGIDLLVFRDSNWTPDFPTAARQAISLYRPGYTVTVAGVIALDQRAVQEIVAAIGPLSLEGVEEMVTGQSIVAYIRQAWGPEDGETVGDWWSQRKSFMGVIAGAAWQRVQGGKVDWFALAQVLLRLVEERHLFVYLEHPEAEALLAEHGWDGGLGSGAAAGDFLMVLGMNMGYNKVNARVRESISYQVDLRQSPPQATLTLVYTHTGSVDVPCKQEPRYGTSYEDMMERCYWYYVQVYVPAGSQLVDATRIPVPGESLLSGEDEEGGVAVYPVEEGPWTALGVFGLLPPASTQTRSFTWTLPADVVKWENGAGSYTLQVRKQPGTLAHPLTVEVRLPTGSVVTDVAPSATVIEDGGVIYQTVLRQDWRFELRFRR